MPYKSAKILIKNTQYDRRIKLTDEQRDEIRTLANSGWSQRKLAKEFKVSRRLIIFVIFPERYEAAKEQFKERRKDGRYKQSNETNAAVKREHDRYKQQLYVKKLIQLPTDKK